MSLQAKGVQPISFRKSQSAVKVPCAMGKSVGAFRRTALVVEDASIQFVKGFDEPCVPAVKLTRSRDGSSGTAKFSFENPEIFSQEMGALGDITGLYMIDDEGEITTTDVSATFVNGQPKGVNAVYVMRSSDEWDRFMRFMQKYAEDNDLGFNKN